MPLPAPHAFGTVPDYGVTGTDKDNGADHSTSQLEIPGDLLNQFKADVIALYARKIGELADVEVVALADGDVLSYHADTGKFKNGTVGAGDVRGPATNTDGKIPQWDGANSKTLKNGLSVVTSVGSPGADTNLPTEAAVRAAIGAASGDVTGPSGAVAGNVAVFSGTTGKLIADGGALGTAAFKSVGVAAGTVAAGDDSRIVGAAQTSSLGDAAFKNTGAAAGTVAAGNDSRIVGAVQSTRQIAAGTGLSGGGDLSADRTLSVQYGMSGTTACVGNDARLSDTRTPTDASVTVTKVAAAALTSLQRKNRLINGNFGVMGNRFASVVGLVGARKYMTDMWAAETVGSSLAATLYEFTPGQTDVPNEPRYYSEWIVSSSAGSGNFARVSQRIEGVRTLAGQQATLSFYAKADAAKNIAIELVQSFGTGGSPSSAVTAIGVTTKALTTGWAKHTVTVTIPSISGKALGTNADDYLEVIFWLDAGSTFNARTNTLGQQSITFDLSQAQLEPGTSATEFEYVDPASELARSRRYCWGVSLATTNIIGAGFTVNTTDAFITMPLPVRMRATPLLVATASDWSLSDYIAVANYDLTGLSISAISTPDCVVLDGVSSGMTNGHPVLLRADGGGTRTMLFSVEL